MNIEEIRNYCISKKGVTEEFPFDNNTLVFKVMGKMFALTSLKSWEQNSQAINLKCTPSYSEELRAEFDNIKPGFHMNKKHWNTIHLHTNEISVQLIKELIDLSYKLVTDGLTKKDKETLTKL